MSGPVIHQLGIDDLDDALALSTTAGWNQRLDDWRMLLRLAPAGSFASVIEGRIIGTAIGIDYGGFGWIAMMLVDPAYRGRGVGRCLLEAALGAVPPDRPIRLDATPLGRPLYERYGFTDESTLTRYVADVLPSRVLAPVDRRRKSLRADQMRAADLHAVIHQDEEVFRGNRSAVLEWAWRSAPQYGKVVHSGTGLLQYCFGRQGRLFVQIGPIVAGDDESAEALVSAAMMWTGGRPIGVDVFDAQHRFSEWLLALGFQRQRPLFRMRRPAAGSSSAIEPSSHPRFREFAILGPEFA
jgi:GNAT superfamily N-acetyltransferase